MIAIIASIAAAVILIAAVPLTMFLGNRRDLKEPATTHELKCIKMWVDQYPEMQEDINRRNLAGGLTRRDYNEIRTAGFSLDRKNALNQVNTHPSAE